ncbi:RIIB protein [Vibrio phage 1.084.O._10N.261.49.F5]|nr:RIIB protein [Vibrio phage 1.084.O._10N.261.49.F5]
MAKSNRSNIVKMLTKEQKLEIFKKYEKKTFSTKKAFAKGFGISTRTLNRVIDEMKVEPITDSKSALCELSKSLCTTVWEVVDRYDYTVTKNQITIFKNDESRSVMKGYPKFTKLRRELIDSDFAEEALRLTYEILSLPDFVEKFSEGDITVDHEKGKVWYGTFEIKNSLTDHMFKKLDEGEDVLAFVKFADMLLQNPKEDIVEELYGFMKHTGIEIDEEGYIIAYKGVRPDYKDWWTGTIDNSVGASPCMPMKDVIHDPESPCGAGLHAGSFKYAKSWARDGHVMSVKIHPAKVGSVPWDCDGQKMRTCGYEVLEEVL